MNIYRIIILYFLLLSNACANQSSDLQEILSTGLKDNANSTHRTKLRKIIKWPDSCEETFSFPTAGFVIFKKDVNNYIAQIVCTYGSYQGMSLFYKINTSGNNPIISKISFPTRNNSKKHLSEIWGNVLTSSTVDKFHILNLFSGYGHCGTLTTYDLSADIPKIIKLKTQDNCDLKPAIRDPEKWKSINVN